MKVKNIIFSVFVLMIGAALFCTGCEPQERGLLTMNLTNTETGAENNDFNSMLRQVPGTTDYEEVYITFTQVSVHKAEDSYSDNETSDNSTEYSYTDNETTDNSTDNDAGGWIIISDEEQGFDLMALRDGAFDLLAESELEAGKYTQIRLKISGDLDDAGDPKTYVRVDGEVMPLTVPSGAQSGLKLIKPFNITADSETILYIDFDAESSVVETGAGKYLLKPTIKVSVFKDLEAMLQ